MARKPVTATASDSELHNELIRGMIAQDQFYAAVAHIQAQRVSSGDSTELRWLEGDARRRLGELNQAERLFNTLGGTAYAAHAQHGLGLIAASRRQDELALRHLASAVALHPTVTGSGLTVVLEAMASGRPVVVTANPGVADYVDHGETGLLVLAGDVDAFAGATEELLADDDRRIEMGRLEAARVRERFTTEVMADHLARMLRAM